MPLQIRAALPQAVCNDTSGEPSGHCGASTCNPYRLALLHPVCGFSVSNLVHFGSCTFKISPVLGIIWAHATRVALRHSSELCRKCNGCMLLPNEHFFRANLGHRACACGHVSLINNLFFFQISLLLSRIEHIYWDTLVWMYIHYKLGEQSKLVYRGLFSARKNMQGEPHDTIECLLWRKGCTK